MATKTVKVCDGCGTDERDPTVALAEAAKNPQKGWLINQWHGADLCLSCRMLVGRVMKRVDKQKETVFINAVAGGPALTKAQKAQVKKEVDDYFLRLMS